MNGNGEEEWHSHANARAARAAKRSKLFVVSARPDFLSTYDQLQPLLLITGHQQHQHSRPKRATLRGHVCHSNHVERSCDQETATLNRRCEKVHKPSLSLTCSKLTKNSFSSSQLTIVVGQETNHDAETFYESPDILAQHSGFFAAVLRNGWKEKEERVVRLPECKPEVFQIFLNFIHTGNIYSRKDGDQSKNPSRNAVFDSELERMCNCWAQGEKLASSVFQDAIVDALCQKIGDELLYPFTLHRNIYSNTSTPNAMSRLLVDIAAWKWKEEYLQDARKDHVNSSAFLGDLALRLFSLSAEERKGPPPFTKNDCTYHEHVKDGKPCYKTIFNYD